jgi:hypothetical protein
MTTKIIQEKMKHRQSPLTEETDESVSIQDLIPFVAAEEQRDLQNPPETMKDMFLETTPQNPDESSAQYEIRKVQTLLETFYKRVPQILHPSEGEDHPVITFDLTTKYPNGCDLTVSLDTAPANYAKTIGFRFGVLAEIHPEKGQLVAPNIPELLPTFFDELPVIIGRTDWQLSEFSVQNEMIIFEAFILAPTHLGYHIVADKLEDLLTWLEEDCHYQVTAKIEE